MESFKDLYNADLMRYGTNKPSLYDRFLLRYFRLYQTSRIRIIRIISRQIYNWLAKSHGIEISCRTKIGRGFLLCHSYNITVNSHAIIGENVSIHKGVLIGQTNRGEKKGVPTIGNSVWIGINAAIVGAVNIGDDVLIAPNSFVNRDIPSHSVVYGNPCVIKPKENATSEYIRVRV